MAETTTYQCPNCGGALHFDGQLGKLYCDFCDSSFEPAEVERIYAERQQKADAKAQAESKPKHAAPETPQPTTRRKIDVDDPVQAYLQYSTLDEEHLRAYNCSSCGAQLLVDEVTAVTSCPYCGNNAVLPGQLSDVLKPDYVIPFVKSKDDAIKALHDYYDGKRLLPDAFTSENHLEEIQGVYVPFWLYTGQTEGRMVFGATQVTSWEDRDNIYTKTDHYRLIREGSLPSSTRVPPAFG